MGGAATKAEFDRKNEEALDEANKKFLSDIRDHTLDDGNCSPTLTPPSSPFIRKKPGRGIISNVDGDDGNESPLEVESLLGDSPPSSPEPTGAVHPYNDEDEPPSPESLKDEPPPPNTPSPHKTDDLAVLSFVSSSTPSPTEDPSQHQIKTELEKGKDNNDDPFFSFASPPAPAVARCATQPSSSPRSDYQFNDSLTPNGKAQGQNEVVEPIPFHLEMIHSESPYQEEAKNDISFSRIEALKDSSMTKSEKKNNEILFSSSNSNKSKYIQNLVSLEYNELDLGDREEMKHDTWHTKSLHRPDSFNVEFLQDEAEAKTIRQQRASAALENMQLEDDVRALRQQLGLETNTIKGSSSKDAASPRWPPPNRAPPIIIPPSSYATASKQPRDQAVVAPLDYGIDSSTGSFDIARRIMSVGTSSGAADDHSLLKSPPKEVGTLHNRQIKGNEGITEEGTKPNPSPSPPRPRRRHRKKQAQDKEHNRNKLMQLKQHIKNNQQQQQQKQQQSQSQQDEIDGQPDRHPSQHQQPDRHQSQHQQPDRHQSQQQQPDRRKDHNYRDENSHQTTAQGSRHRSSSGAQSKQSRQSNASTEIKEEQDLMRLGDEEGGESGGGGRSEVERPWSASMKVRCSEVELILRKPITSNEDITYTLASAEAGLLFMDRIDATAKKLGVLRGVLSRWILPYGSMNQSVAEQKSTSKEVLENIPEEFRDRLSEKEIGYLVRGANSVRKLIRIKIADDNDLNQAKASLLTVALFFRRVSEEALQTRIDPINLVRLHRESTPKYGGGRRF